MAGTNLLVTTTALASFISGFVLSYLMSRDVGSEKRKFNKSKGGRVSKGPKSRGASDELKSDESDVDEDDSLLDHAPNWHNGEAADRKQGLRIDKVTEECKLVLVVRTDLGMTKGKIAAQCSHATLACFKKLSRAPAGTPEHTVLSRWERLGQAKIAVQVKSQEEMLDLCRKARGLGLTAEVIQDAGRTQIEAGSMTVLGVGPAPKSLVDQVTGHLKLL